MVHVHGRGRARRERREPSDHTRLGRVRLDDVRAERADLRGHPREGLGVGEDVRRTAQPVDAGDRERPWTQLELVDLVGSDAPGQQPLLEARRDRDRPSGRRRCEPVPRRSSARSRAGRGRGQARVGTVAAPRRTLARDRSRRARRRVPYPDLVRSLVTGGAGFIGSHLVDALARRRRRGDGPRQPRHRPAREPSSRRRADRAGLDPRRRSRRQGGRGRRRGVSSRRGGRRPAHPRRSCSRAHAQ